MTFDRGLPAGLNQPTLGVHWASDGRKLADVFGVTASKFDHWDRESIGNDQRYMLLPAAKSLVVLPETNDRLMIYSFDLDAILEKTLRPCDAELGFLSILFMMVRDSARFRRAACRRPMSRNT